MTRDRRSSDDDLGVTQDLEIDRVCVQFEQQLDAGSTPPIEDYLARVEPSLRSRFLTELLLTELEHRRRQAETPAIEDYLQRFPHDRELIHRAFVHHLRSADRTEPYPDRPRSDEESSGAQHASSTDSSDHGRFLPGTKLAGRYRIVSRLGRGGMGEVYRADDLKLGHGVALKFLPKLLAQDRKRLEYFYNEVRLSRQIAHPNVCRVYDIAEANGEHFLSMEYIDGEDLKTLLRHVGRFPRDRGVQIARQLCAGLSAAHDRGVLHRDLKPANVMIDGRGNVRITDFGLATAIRDQGSSDSLVGTPAYIAPEQRQRAETSIRSDIYSLGLVLYEVFTGEIAQRSSPTAGIDEDATDGSTPSRPSELVDDIDPAIERVMRHFRRAQW